MDKQLPQPAWPVASRTNDPRIGGAIVGLKASILLSTVLLFSSLSVLLWLRAQPPATSGVAAALGLPDVLTYLIWVGFPLVFGCWLVEAQPDHWPFRAAAVTVCTTIAPYAAAVIYPHPMRETPANWLFPSSALVGVLLPFLAFVSDPASLTVGQPCWANHLRRLGVTVVVLQATSLAAPRTTAWLVRTNARLRQAQCYIFVLHGCPASRVLLSTLATDEIKSRGAHFVVVQAGSPDELALWNEFGDHKVSHPSSYPTVVTAGSIVIGSERGVALAKSLDIHSSPVVGKRGIR